MWTIIVVKGDEMTKETFLHDKPIALNAKMVDFAGWPDSWYVFAGYSLIVALVFAVIFRYKHDPTKFEKVSH